MQVERQTLPSRNKAIRGSTLIEVLIAVLVLSIGLLGALKLQTAGVRLNADSRYSEIATTYAQDALDALTFNPLGEKDSWTSIQCSTKATSSSLSGTPLDWLTRLKTELPSGCANISCDSDNHMCSVQIEWVLPGHTTDDKSQASYVVYN